VADRRSELVAEHLPLVRSLARRYAGRGEPLDDLEQVGVIGLMKAIDRYDPARGTDLRAFATPTILGEIRRHFRDRAWVVNVPRTVKDAYPAVIRATEALNLELRRSPTVAEVAEYTGVPDDVVLDALAAGSAYRPASLAAAEHGDPPIQLAASEGDIADVVDQASFDDTIAALSPMQRTVVRLRFTDDLTQSQIAARLGISQMHVSRLLRASLARLRGVGDP
jgi:RNA polymerase sigma-B factor